MLVYAESRFGRQEDFLEEVTLELRPEGGAGPGDVWETCARQREEQGWRS